MAAEDNNEEGELITEDNPRIKFACTRAAQFELAASDASAELSALCRLMARMEASGAAPVLNDGKVGGNCAVCEALAVNAGSAGGGSGDGSGRGSSKSGSSNVPAAAPAPPLLVSRSGKSAGAALTAADFVRVRAFDRKAWGAEFESRDDDTRPSSDTPLLWACLSPGACAEYGWAERPRVALHGHALATGAGLEAARAAGVPISERATLFSTPADLAALEALLRAHPYPATRLYVRRGHGFFALGRCVADVEAEFGRVAAIAAAAAAASSGAAAAVAASTEARRQG